MVWTIKVGAQSKQQHLNVFIFRNPVAIQFFFVAILSDCSRIAGLPVFGKWKTTVSWTSPTCFKIHMQLRLDFQVVMTCCFAQDIGIKILIRNPTNGFHSPMKSVESQSNRSAFHQSRLRWDCRKQAIPWQSDGMREGFDHSGIDAILARSDQPSCNPEEMGRSGCDPQSNLT